MPRVYYKDMFPVDFPEGATQQDVEEYFQPYKDGGNTFTDGVRTVAGMLSKYQNRQQPQSVMPRLSGLIGLNQDQINNLMSLSQRDQMFQQQQRQEQDLAEKARQQRMFELAEARKNYRDQLTGRLRSDMVRQAANIRMKEIEAERKANAPRVLSQGQQVYDAEGKMLYGNEKPEATRMVKVWRGGKQYTVVGTDKDIQENPDKYASEQPPRRGGEGGGGGSGDASKINWMNVKRAIDLGMPKEQAEQVFGLPLGSLTAIEEQEGGSLQNLGEAINKYNALLSAGVHPNAISAVKEFFVKTQGMSPAEAEKAAWKRADSLATSRMVTNAFKDDATKSTGDDDDKKVEALIKDADNIMNTEKDVNDYETALSRAAERRIKAEQFVKGKTSTPPAPAGTTSEQDKAALEWAKQNPNDPRAKQILSSQGL